MDSGEIRKRFLDFFESRGHAIIPSASLIPENDPSALFISAGVQPLVPFLLGEKHPKGSRLANVQKCVRTTDIDEVGDSAHLTFFEMLGNWSLGDPDAEDGIGAGYFKGDAIKWSYEFLTSKKEGLGLDPSRIYITVFEGDENAPRDKESAEAWKEVGVPENRIYYRGAEDNWWSPGDNGPCGPDTEMYYDVTKEGLGYMTPEEFQKADDSQRVVEIWNDVFMEYEKRNGKVVGKLKAKNVDTGAGLERMAQVMQGKESIFDIDIFSTLMTQARVLVADTASQRVIADHMRASVFIIGEGIVPSNTDRGYVLRRLIRRAVMKTDKRHIDPQTISALVDFVVSRNKDLVGKQSEIKSVIEAEVKKFEKTLQRGLRQLDKLGGSVSGRDAFILFTTYGFPIELTKEIIEDKGASVGEKEFSDEMEKHRKLSRPSGDEKFKGGLGDHSEMSVKYHTATHLLLQALRDVLGNHVEQRGSNITSKRLRLDFSHPKKMADSEKEKVEKIVNLRIKEDLSVSWEEMNPEEAKKAGATGIFDGKYGDLVKVFSIGDPEDSDANKRSGQVYSKEICGGPHVKSTGKLGHFKIKKEESVSSGVRRIKAILE